MSIKFYAYPKCSTCRKAQSFLNKKKRAYEAIDITISPPSKKELKSMLAAVKGEMRRLFNTSGQVYKEMGLAKKLDTFTEEEALKLLSENGRLIKRPFLVIDGTAVAIGFLEKDWNEAL